MYGCGSVNGEEIKELGSPGRRRSPEASSGEGHKGFIVPGARGEPAGVRGLEF